MGRTRFMKWGAVAVLWAAVLFPVLAQTEAPVAAQSEESVSQSASLPEEGALSKRIEAQFESDKAAWAILPYRPTYVLPVAYNPDINEEPLEANGITSNNMQDVEIKFQISFLLPVWREAFGGFGDLCFGYTQISVWQAYDREDSSPFRDTNYEPEFFLRKDTDYDLFGLHGRMIMLGAVHQSNGRGNEELSRSWNRLYANFLFEKDRFSCALKPWYRIPENEEDDNNPDIDEYLGYGEFRAAYKFKKQECAMMFRNNMQSENKSTIQLDWIFPLSKHIKGYVQYFDGWGEVLLDYNHYDQRIGAGFLLGEWL
jgi:phospholipase A1/A2